MDLQRIGTLVTGSHANARSLAYKSMQWLEYVSPNLMPFSVYLDGQSIALYAKIIFNVASGEGYALDPAIKEFNAQQVYKLRGEVQFLDLKKLIKNVPLDEYTSHILDEMGDRE